MVNLSSWYDFLRCQHFPHQRYWCFLFTVSCAKSCFVLVLSIASIDILLSFTIYLFEQILIQKCDISFQVWMCQNTKCVTKVMCHSAHQLVYIWQLGATFYIWLFSYFFWIMLMIILVLFLYPGLITAHP